MLRVLRGNKADPVRAQVTSPRMQRPLDIRLRMIASVDSSFQSAIDELSLPGIMIGHRLISPGDERALMPEEAPAFAASVVEVRRASGAARIVARELLARLGHPDCALPKSPSGAPRPCP